jgi:hypothetical protein
MMHTAFRWGLGFRPIGQLAEISLAEIACLDLCAKVGYLFARDSTFHPQAYLRVVYSR